MLSINIQGKNISPTYDYLPIYRKTKCNDCSITVYWSFSFRVAAKMIKKIHPVLYYTILLYFILSNYYNKLSIFLFRFAPIMAAFYSLLFYFSGKIDAPCTCDVCGKIMLTLYTLVKKVKFANLWMFVKSILWYIFHFL